MRQEDLAREIHHTTLDEGCWPAVIRSLTSHLGAHSAYLLSPTEQAGPRSFGYTHEIADELNARYREYYHRHDLFLRAARARGMLCSGAVINTEALLPPDELLNSELYNGFLRPHGIRHCMAGVLTDEQDNALGPRTHLAFFRAPGSAPFDAKAERRLSHLLPHLRLALTSHWKLRSQGLLGEWNEQLLAQIDQPFLLLSRGGRLLYANQVGLSVVRDSRGLSVRDGVLYRGEPASPLTGQFDPLTDTPVLLPAAPPDVPTLRVIPLRTTVTTRSLFHWFPRAAYVVLPQQSAVDAEAGETDFGRRHGLTSAEQRVLARLVEGQSPRSVAASLRISVHTVRAHLAHIFAKTNSRNQRELLVSWLRYNSR